MAGSSLRGVDTHGCPLAQTHAPAQQSARKPSVTAGSSDADPHRPGRSRIGSRLSGQHASERRTVQTRLTRHGGNDTSPLSDCAAWACTTGSLNYLRPFLPRLHLQQQRALGHDAFRAMVEAKTDRFAGVRPAHRPRKPNTAD